jgi:hypothetical protein
MKQKRFLLTCILVLAMLSSTVTYSFADIRWEKGNNNNGEPKTAALAQGSIAYLPASVNPDNNVSPPALVPEGEGNADPSADTPAGEEDVNIPGMPVREGENAPSAPSLPAPDSEEAKDDALKRASMDSDAEKDANN